MDFVQHDEAMLVLLEEHRRRRKARSIRWRLEIQIDRVHLVGDRNRKGGLPHLPRPDKRHSGLPSQRNLHLLLCVARNHPC